MCSQACTADVECAGIEDTNCESGFVCAVMAELGPLCCQGVCACADNLVNTGDLEYRCGAGQVECCWDDEGNPADPLPGGCFGD